MSESSWSQIWRDTQHKYAIGEEAALILVALAACLAFVAVSVAAHTYLKQREKKLSLREATSHLLRFVWLLPVAAVFVLVLLCFALLSSWTVIGPAEGVVISESIEQASRRRKTVGPAIDETDKDEFVEQAGRVQSHDPRDELNGEAAGKADDQAAERPAWIDAPESDGSRRLVVVEGGQFSDPETARRDALNKAVRIVRDDFFASPRPEGEHARERFASHPGVHVAVRSGASSRREERQAHAVRGAPSDWQPPIELVQAHAVKETYVERIQRSTGNNDFFVYRAYHQVELSPEVREALFPSWRSHTVDGRLWILGGLLGFVVLMLGTAATYLRLDAVTGGNYRRRLKLASVTFLLAGGLGLAALLPIA